MQFFLSFLIVIITLISVLNTKCVPISDYILSSSYLNNLEADKEISLISKKSIYEENRKEFLSTLNRHKRYTLMSTKWPKTKLTWRFDQKNKETFVKEEQNIRRIIHEALNVWEADSILKFQESREGYADIMISFEQPKHPEIDPYFFRSHTLAHAFIPGNDLGGDIHFNELINWDFSVSYDSKPEEDKLSFFAAVLHYIGHSLGLGDSKDNNSVMSKNSSEITSRLSEDDIRGIQHIYGVPQNRKFKTSSRMNNDEEDSHVWD